MTSQSGTRTSAWQPGISGNPSGRPAGSGEVAKLRASISERLPELLDSLMTSAIGGDTGAAKLLLERTLPPLRPVDSNSPVRIDGDTLADQGRSVLGAVGAGEITPASGAAIINALAVLAKIDDAGEQARSIALIEAAMKLRRTN